MDYELASGNEPVEVTTDGDKITVTLGPLTLTYQTHRDADAWDERHELIEALRGSEAPLVEAVDRVKLTQARDQAMAVLYAMHRGVTMGAAVNALRPAFSEAFLRSVGEWDPAVGRARQEARKLLADCLRGHRWSVLGNRIGPPPQKKCRALDLDSGEMVQTRPVPVDRAKREGDWEWVDYNAMTVEEDRAGDWWQITGAVQELPFSPWDWELEHVTGGRNTP